MVARSIQRKDQVHLAICSTAGRDPAELVNLAKILLREWKRIRETLPTETEQKSHAVDWVKQSELYLALMLCHNWSTTEKRSRDTRMHTVYPIHKFN